jgi:hypothetical protein
MPKESLHKVGFSKKCCDRIAQNPFLATERNTNVNLSSACPAAALLLGAAYTFLAGEHPGSRNPSYALDALSALRDAGIRTWIDLTEEAEWFPYPSLLRELAQPDLLKLDYLRFAIPDRQTPSVEQMSQILDAIDRSHTEGRAVYIHCLAGIGRTGTAVACYLIRHGIASDKVLHTLQNLRRYSPDAAYPSPETEEQRQFVQIWQPDW